MPWSKSDYPDSMKNLSSSVRNKAIDIANAMIEEKDMDEGMAIATAISRAKQIANRGNTKTNSKLKSNGQHKHKSKVKA